MIAGGQPESTAVTDLRSEDGELRFNVAGPFGEHTIRFWGDVPPNRVSAVEVALATALLPAMASGTRLSLPGPVSPQLRRALPDIQSVLAMLAASSTAVEAPLERVEIESVSDAAAGPPADQVAERARGTGLFFSGGVDSLSALLGNPEADDLIYVHGFDIPLEDEETSATVERFLGELAEQLGRRLLVVRTNLRELLDPSVSWEISHGPALVAVALLMAPRCERVEIGAGMTYGALTDRGSHPLHDHLWSTERLRIEHRGAHLTRAEKTAQVASSQAALDILRVCWRDVGSYNCGHCEKCLRTMVVLEILGALERCPTFSVPLDLEAVAKLEIPAPETCLYWRESLALGRERGASPELISAVEDCLARNERIHFGVGELAETAERERLLTETLHSLTESRSWRLTAPLRRAGSARRRFRRDPAGG